MRPRRAALAIGLLAGLALPVLVASARSQEGHGEVRHSGPSIAVGVGFATLRPEQLEIVSGDKVRWTNESSRVHTVTADDGSFDSGRLTAGATFSREFTTAAEVPYHCALHPTIRGVVGVRDLLLNIPGQAAAPKREFPLSGRSALPAGTPVSIEADRGDGFEAIASTIVGPGRAFSVRFVPRTTATYRAVSGAVTSPGVQLVVLDRRVALTAAPGRHGSVVLRTAVTPAARGGRVVLQLFLPDRFGWWPVQRTRLDSRSAARFALRTRRRRSARVLLTLPDGATPLAVSRTVRVGPSKR